MNVYDFDKTIYPKDSSAEFYLFNLKKDPLLIRYLPIQAWAFLRYTLKLIPKTTMKQEVYRYFRGIPDMEQRVHAFWETRQHKIQPFYLKQKKTSDVIISASPEFLLRPIIQKLGVNLIASIVDPKLGTHQENCYGDQKPLRFLAQFPKASIEAFYSDSLSDTPMARLAKRAYLVSKESIVSWPHL